MNFFKEYSGPSLYHKDTTTLSRVYLTSITGEIKVGAEIKDFAWLTKEDFVKKRFPMIQVNEKEIIPDLIKGKRF